MVAHEHEAIADLIAAHRARLHQLQKKQALLGVRDTPEHIPLEIERIEDAIERLSGQPIEMTTREKYLVDLHWQTRIEGDLYKLDQKLDRLAGLVEQLDQKFDRKLDGLTGMVQQMLAELALRALPPPPPIGAGETGAS